jgi:hypothetical protein
MTKIQVLTSFFCLARLLISAMLRSKISSVESNEIFEGLYFEFIVHIYRFENAKIKKMETKILPLSKFKR